MFGLLIRIAVAVVVCVIFSFFLMWCTGVGRLGVSSLFVDFVCDLYVKNLDAD